MKRVFVGIICILCFTIGIIIGSLIYKGTAYENNMEYTATMLTESFGWKTIAEPLESYKVSVQNFYQQYYHITGGDPYSQTNGNGTGNINGITPEILDKNYFELSNSQYVQIYYIPLDYDMPDGTSLQSIIGFYEGEICISCIHVNIEDIGIVNTAIEDTILPLTWGLDVDKNTVLEWKNNYFKNVFPS